MLPALARAQAVFGGLAVGQSTQQQVTVTAQAAGSVNSVQVLTLGQPSLDFSAGTGASTCATATLTVGGPSGSCTESVSFTPSLPGLRIGAVVLLDFAGNVLATADVSGTGLGGLGVLMPGNITPVAGDGGYLGTIDDGNPATDAELWWPTSQVVDGAGNLYIADSLHNRIRMVCAGATNSTVTIKGTGTNCTAAGIIVTIAGTGNPSYTGDTGPAGAATLNQPAGIALDGAGNLYIADTGNSVIREIIAATGKIYTIAGVDNGTSASICGAHTDAVGDGCPATQAIFSTPESLTLDASGNIYIADTYNHRIRMVTASTGLISTVAGNGTITDASTGAGGYSGDGAKAIDAELNFPWDVAFDPSGNMYIADSQNNVIRKVAAIGGVITSNSNISTFAGNYTKGQGNSGDGGTATQAQLDSPLGVAVDAAGNLWIADTGNHSIRRVNPSTLVITTLIKTGTGSSYYNSNFVTIQLYGPTGLYFDGKGNLYIADSHDMTVQELQGNVAALDLLTPPVRQYSKSSERTQTIENDGNAPLDVTAITPDSNSTVDDSTLGAFACGIGDLVADQACGIGAVFYPQVAQNPLIANIDVAGNTQDTPSPITAANSPLDIKIIGDATAVNSTTITVSGSPSTAGYGQPVTLSAIVQTGSGTGNLTGTVTFYDNTSTVIAANVPVGATTTSGSNSSATASTTTTTLPVGTDQITAVYNVTGTPADPTHLTSNNDATPFPEIIDEATATTLQTSGSPSAIGQPVTFTATVSISGGGGVTPDGTVTFYDGANAIGSQNLTPNGLTASASLTTSSLAQGSHSITAQYSGGIVNTAVQASTSNTVTQDVQDGTSVAVTSANPNPSNYGQQVTFTASVTPTGGAYASGTVKFYYGTTLIGTGTLVGSTNQTSITYSQLPVGNPDNITATYSGDGNNAPSSTAAPYVQVVNKTQTSTTVTGSPTPNGIAGGSISFTATVAVVSGSASVTGTVSFTSNGNSLGAPVAVNSTTGKATLTLSNVAPNTFSVIATYSGDSNDDASTSSPAFPYTVVPATTNTAVTVSPTSALVGEPVTFTAKVTGNGGIPTGNVIFQANGSPIGAAVNLDGTGTAKLTSSSLATGSYTITAVYSGDTDDTASTGTAGNALVIGTIATTTDLTSATTTTAPPQVVLVAAVLNSQQVSGGTTPAPTGTVTFKYGGTVIGSASVASSGVATLPLSLPAGTYAVVAYYGGDSTHSPSSSQAVNITTTATTFNISISPGSITMATSQYYTANVNLASVSGFNDTVTLGCAGLPLGVTCNFSPQSVNLPANGTASAQLIIDTNNPLTGGSQALNTPSSGRRVALAGVFLPFAVFFGWVFWRFRRRNTRFFALVLVLALSAAALFATGCGGFTTNDAKPGTYTIEVTGTGTNSGVIHFGNVTLTIK